MRLFYKLVSAYCCFQGHFFKLLNLKNSYDVKYFSRKMVLFKYDSDAVAVVVVTRDIKSSRKIFTMIIYWVLGLDLSSILCLVFGSWICLFQLSVVAEFLYIFSF